MVTPAGATPLLKVSSCSLLFCTAFSKGENLAPIHSVIPCNMAIDILPGSGSLGHSAWCLLPNLYCHGVFFQIPTCYTGRRSECSWTQGGEDILDEKNEVFIAFFSCWASWSKMRAIFTLDECSRQKMYEVESCSYAKARQIESKDKVLNVSLSSFLLVLKSLFYCFMFLGFEDLGSSYNFWLHISQVKK